MSSSYTPDVGQQIDAQGNVSYDFAGHVHAQGIDLDVGLASTPPDTNRIRWLDSGTDKGGLLCYQLKPGQAPPPYTAATKLYLDNAGNSIEVYRSGSGVHEIKANADGYSALILDSNGRSDFLRLPFRAGTAASMGGADLFFNGVYYSDQLAIAHGLGAAPWGVICSVQAPSYTIANAIVVNETANRDSTYFYVRGRTVSGAAIGPGTVRVTWVAFIS